MYPSVQLNEVIKRLLPKASSAYAKQPKEIEKATRLPYLTYQAPENDDINLDEATQDILRADDGLLKTPFPAFRFCCTSHCGMQMLGMAARKDGEMWALMWHREKSKKPSLMLSAIWHNENGKVVSEGKMWDADSLEDVSMEMKYSAETVNDDSVNEMAFRGTSDPAVRAQILSRLRNDANRKERRIEQMKDLLSGLEQGIAKVLPETGVMPESQPTDIFMAWYNIILIMCYEYTVPHNFIARVWPDTPGKSVEWKQAREHLTLIHRHHPANSADVEAGARITSDKNPTRIAHSRRAHTKLLKSPKFKFKQGQRIFVKASWCGPKEWKDTAGQTYQILIPVNR